MKFEYDGDKITGFANSVVVNGQTLKCSKETASKFLKLFKSKKESFLQGSKNKEEKEVKDKLKAKYNK
jgi:hypothetical protein